jgi:hypothetical protein
MLTIALAADSIALSSIHVVQQQTLHVEQMEIAPTVFSRSR